MQRKRGVFISYRRGPATWAANALRRVIADRFPSASVFLDGASIDGGADWPKRLREALDESAVLIVLIGEGWATVQKGARLRLDLENDWVRAEIVHGLKHSFVLPVLIDDAQLPKNRDELPLCIQPLLDLQALRYRSAPRDEDNDITDVLRALEPHLPATSEPVRAPQVTSTSKSILEGFVTIQEAVSMVVQVADEPKALLELARAARGPGGYELAEALYAVSCKQLSEQRGIVAPLTRKAKHEWALTLVSVGRSEEAEVIFASLSQLIEELGDRDPTEAESLKRHRARALMDMGRLEDAEKLLRSAVEKTEDETGDLGTLSELARVVRSLGKLDEALELTKAVVKRCIETYGNEHPRTLFRRHGLAEVLLELGDFDKAVEVLSEVLSKRVVSLGQSGGYTLVTRRALTRALLEKGDVTRARHELMEISAHPSTTPRRKAQLALYRAWIADVDGDITTADNSLIEAEQYLIDEAPWAPVRQQLHSYIATRTPGMSGGTTLSKGKRSK